MPDPEKISVTWIEVLLLAALVLGGMGIVRFVERRVDSELKHEEPREDQYLREAGVAVREAELAVSQGALSTAQAKLIEHQLEAARQESKLAALLANYPTLAASPPPTASPPPAGVAPPADILKDYNQTKVDRDAARRMAGELGWSREFHLMVVAERSKSLADARHAAQSNLIRARENFARRKRWATLSCAAVFLALFLLAAFLISLGSRFGRNRAAVFLIAALTLGVLLGYQSFEMMGAAVAGTLALLIIAATISRRPQA